MTTKLGPSLASAAKRRMKQPRPPGMTPEPVEPGKPYRLGNPASPGTQPRPKPYRLGNPESPGTQPRPMPIIKRRLGNPASPGTQPRTPPVKPGDPEKQAEARRDLMDQWKKAKEGRKKKKKYRL